MSHLIDTSKRECVICGAKHLERGPFHVVAYPEGHVRVLCERCHTRGSKMLSDSSPKPYVDISGLDLLAAEFVAETTKDDSQIDNDEIEALLKVLGN